jgi:hypothetical protein
VQPAVSNAAITAAPMLRILVMVSLFLRAIQARGDVWADSTVSAWSRDIMQRKIVSNNILFQKNSM